MATYRDAALAAYTSRRQARIKRGQDRLVPLMTDATGKAVLDPYSKTTLAHDDPDAGLLVFTTTDGSNVSFGVWPDMPAKAVHVVELLDGRWTLGPAVADLDDVGEALQEATS